MAELLARRMVFSKVRGVEASKRKLRKIVALEKKGFEEGVRLATEFILEEAIKVTPIDTGFLRSSGGYTIVGSGFNTKGFIVFSAPYAIYVHEDLSKWHASGTYAKFLERTAIERGPEASAIIARTVSRYAAMAA